jgi:hypothetical protein
MASAAALALLAAIPAANAQSAPTGTNTAEKPKIEQPAPKANAPTHMAKVHHAMRTRHVGLRETTGAARNDPSIHQSAGDRDSRGYPKQH